jgi:hypothetical protein
MMPTLGFVSYHQGRELLFPPPQRRICRLFFFSKNTTHYHEYAFITPHPPHPPPSPDVSVDALLPVVTVKLTINSDGRIGASEFM